MQSLFRSISFRTCRGRYPQRCPAVTLWVHAFFQGVFCLVIRPFQLDDLLLVHRLGGQASKLNAIQALLYPRSAAMAALGAYVPGIGGNVRTYVLRQRRNSLAHAGFIQVQKRSGRPEADILMLAPALDTSWGHPAIWEKLLSHYAREAARQNISRIYADVPDQPLLVHTFSQVGFKPYTRQTIWRLAHYHTPSTTTPPINGSAPQNIRIQVRSHEWALTQLYRRVTPEAVQRAEGAVGAELEKSVKPVVLDWWQSSSYSQYVLMSESELRGCLLIGRSPRGYWMRILADTQNPDTHHIHCLLRHGLQVVNTRKNHLPIYMGVRDYHGGLGRILADYGFAPFTDRARMVRHVPAWARQSARQRLPAVETVGEAIPTSFALPQPGKRSTELMSQQFHSSQADRHVH